MRVTQKVDDPFIVSSKQPYGVFEEQHESRVDYSIGELVRVGLERRRETEGSKRLHQFPKKNVCLSKCSRVIFTVASTSFLLE